MKNELLLRDTPPKLYFYTVQHSIPKGLEGPSKMSYLSSSFVDSACFQHSSCWKLWLTTLTLKILRNLCIKKENYIAGGGSYG